MFIWHIFGKFFSTCSFQDSWWATLCELKWLSKEWHQICRLVFRISLPLWGLSYWWVRKPSWSKISWGQSTSQLSKISSDETKSATGTCKHSCFLHCLVEVWGLSALLRSQLSCSSFLCPRRKWEMLCLVLCSHVQPKGDGSCAVPLGTATCEARPFLLLPSAYVTPQWADAENRLQKTSPMGQKNSHTLLSLFAHLFPWIQQDFLQEHLKATHFRNLETHFRSRKRLKQAFTEAGKLKGW